MKKCLLILIFLRQFSLLAQCPFDPTVTPSNLILCPGSTDTLWTQSYDAYQWYQDNSLLSGATNQFYVVNSSGSYYSVAATLDTCTEESPQVLVDGWAFLLPFVIHSGDLGYYDPELGATILCQGDTLILTLGNPYNTNVQWYDNGDSIAGATENDLLVTESGIYTACGAPDVCPEFIQCGLDIAVLVMSPTPVITQSNDTLFSNIAADSYQWYYNGNIITGATNSFYVPTATGEYSVGVTDPFGCNGASVPYFFTATSIATPQNSFELFPTITRNLIFIKCPQPISLITIHDELGNEVLYPGARSQYIDVSELPPGVYYLSAQLSEGVVCRKFIRY